MIGWQTKIKNRLRQCAQDKLLRTRTVHDSLGQGRAMLENNVSVNFSSNDYLGLSHDRRLRRIYSQAFLAFPGGSGGSSLVTGFHRQHRDLEQRFAEFMQTQAAVLIPSGYQANLSIISALSAFDCHWFIDKQSHASIYDALTLSQSSFTRFRHNDVLHLKNLTAQAGKGDSLILVEGVNSMTGCIAPCSEIAILNQGLIIDDAHAIGVLGQSGRGSIEYHGLNPDDVLAVVSPLGKAFHSQGAIIAGKQCLIDAIRQFARPFIYSTAPSPALAKALTQTLELIQSLNGKRQYLQDLIACFLHHRNKTSWHWHNSSAPIQQLILGDSEKACDLSDYLLKQGIWCLPMRSPSVPKAQTGLRIVLTCHHNEDDINQLFIGLREFLDD